jgi:alkanesulfonate monooxygenase
LSASLDHISRGRSGWNVVTSAGTEQAQNFGKDEQDPVELRYARALEYVDVVRKLWDSWEDDAYIRDREAGIFYDPVKMHVTNHNGEFYKVKGPLNLMRPPQGHPVLAQAGSSGPGKQLAASIGDIIFTPHTGQAAREYRREIKQLAQSMGRDPDSVKVLSQITPVVGQTQQDADDKWAELQRLAHPDILRATVEAMSGLNLAGLDLDQPIPEDVGGVMRVTGYHDAVMDYIRTQKPTVRELIHGYKGPGTIVGTPCSIADYMESEVDSGACDGFILLVQGMPEELEDFVDMTVPELQRRGRFRSHYEGKTLRDHLGLSVPYNQFEGKASEVLQSDAWNALT